MATMTPLPAAARPVALAISMFDDKAGPAAGPVTPDDAKFVVSRLHDGAGLETVMPGPTIVEGPS